MPLDGILQVANVFKDIDVGQALQSALDFLQTPEGISTYVAASTAAATAFIDRYVQQREADIFPSAPSRFTEHGDENPTGRFYATVNDLCMGVTQLWNHTRKEGFDQFQSTAASTPIQREAFRIREVSEQMKGLIAKHSEVAILARRASALFDASWDYRSHDNYHTEVYTTTTTDSKGRTSTQVHTRQVYDDTDHYFTRHFDKAVEGKQVLDTLYETISANQLYAPDLKDTPVKADSSDIARIQETINEDKAEITQDEADAKLNAWSKAAIVKRAIPEANTQLQSTSSTKDSDLAAIKDSKDSYHYNTTSTSHSGPSGYQSAMRLRDQLSNVGSLVGSVESGIEKAVGTAQTLAALFQASVELDDKKICKQRVRQALDLAVETYAANFPGSEIKFDQRTSGVRTTLVALGAGVVFGGAALALQYYLL